MNIYNILESLNISFEEIVHKPVYTAKEAQHIKEKINGVGCKNLFLKDSNNNYYLYLLEDTKKADFKNLSKILNTSHLTFASDEELNNILGLSRGGVTPLGIINDSFHITKIIIDKELISKKILMHTDTNTKTVAIKYTDLIKFIEYFDNKYFVI